MIMLLFCAALVGLPMAIGVHEIVAKVTPRDLRVGVAAVMYAVVLAWMFAVLLPEGKVVAANLQLKMPVAVAAGALVGLVTGLRRRAKSK